jgi:hypothetical protein
MNADVPSLATRSNVAGMVKRAGESKAKKNHDSIFETFRVHLNASAFIGVHLWLQNP